MQISNPYLNTYKTLKTQISPHTTMQEAEELSTHLSMAYNALGTMLKDIIKLLSHLYQSKQTQSTKQTKPLIIQVQSNPSASISSMHQNGAKPSEQKKQSHCLNILNFDKYRLSEGLASKNQTKLQKVLDENSSNGHNYERIQKARNKKEREQLNGYSCQMCEKFYRVLDCDYSDSNGQNKLCDGCSRHRSNAPATKYFNDFSQEFGFED